MKRFSRAADALLGQPMFQLLARVQELERAGKDIVRFEIGDTTFGAHRHVVEATKQALDEGHVLYTNSQGLYELRQAICDHTEATLGFRPTEDQVVVMPANGVIDAVVRCVVNRGESLVAPDPGFPTYAAVASYTGIRRNTYPQRLRDGQFFVERADVEAALDDDTRLIISNSPNNPTGMTSSPQDAEDLYEVAKQNDVYLLSDEIYSRLLFDGAHCSPSVHDACQERIIVLNGFSKGYAMSGWRLGYAIAPPALAKKLTLLFETVYSCIPPFIQRAGIAALTEHQEEIEVYRTRIQKSRDRLVEQLNDIPGISCTAPRGAIYLFADISGTSMTSQEFADRALEEASVALLPGTNFGPGGEGYVRLCFARELETIEEGCRRLQQVFGVKERQHETVGLRS